LHDIEPLFFDGFNTYIITVYASLCNLVPKMTYWPSYQNLAMKKIVTVRVEELKF